VSFWDTAGRLLNEDGYVFSRDGFGELPWIPDTVGHWFRDVAAAAGVDATIESMRHYNATLMLTGGIDLRTAAARLGHGGGGHMTLGCTRTGPVPPISGLPRSSPAACEEGGDRDD
jgi:hypothetical protein